MIVTIQVQEALGTTNRLAVTDSPQLCGDPMEVAERLLEVGATTALVTLAARPG